MGIESGVIARLNAVTQLTDLVSNRIYADIIPDGVVYPAIAYQLISNVVYSYLTDDTNIYTARVQLTIVSSSKLESISVADAVVTAFQRYKGAVSDITILDSKIENMFDTNYDMETGQTARVIDAMITYEV